MDAIIQFRKSMDIGYEQWHDGVGYDLDALDRLDEQGRKEAERLLVPRSDRDWRDLEALDRLGTPGALRAIVDARDSEDHEVRLYAHAYGPEPSLPEMESAILYGLKRAEPYAGLVLTLRCAREHPTPAIIEALWDKVSQPSSIAYHAAETLCQIAGVLEDEGDTKHRGLFLRLVGPDSEARRLAVAELETLTGSP